MEIIILSGSLFVAIVVIIVMAFKMISAVSKDYFDERMREKENEYQRLLEAEDKRFASLLQSTKEANNANINALESRFAVLAAEILETKAKSLSKENVDIVAPLFNDLKEKFEALKKASEAAKEANMSLGASLTTKLDEVGKKAQALGAQADEFVVALRGGNKIQGNWGEGILLTALERAGLQNGVNFDLQKGTDSARPDAVIHDGIHRHIIIDSKVNIDCYMKASEAKSQKEADDFLLKHAQSVREQITGLAKKKYPSVLKKNDIDPEADYADIVIMMMPSEATYAAAVGKDVELLSFANQNKIVLASPQMLFGYLVLFKKGLERLQTEKYYQNIADCARQIVERMDVAMGDLEAIGTSLDNARDTYSKVLGKLGDGTNRQNVLAPAKKIIELTDGAAARTLKSSMLTNAR